MKVAIDNIISICDIPSTMLESSIAKILTKYHSNIWIAYNVFKNSPSLKYIE